MPRGGPKPPWPPCPRSPAGDVRLGVVLGARVHRLGHQEQHLPTLVLLRLAPVAVVIRAPVDLVGLHYIAHGVAPRLPGRERVASARRGLRANLQPPPLAAV
jgi:hypothetical protein